MKLTYICSIAFIFGCFCEVTGWWRSGRKDCIIPRGDLYDRATFRLQYGYDTRLLARGETVEQYIGVVVVCNKDILTDLITEYHVLTCHRGKWKPSLPDCQGPTKCARLEPVANAISEALLGNDIDYPHGTVLRYRCKEGYTMNGHSERHCKNGLWDDIKFNCTRKPEGPKKCKNLTPVENAIAEETMPETNPEYPHGTMIRYRCKEGYRLAGNNKIQCQNGTWEDVKFHCLRYEGPKKCKNLTPVENAVAEETMPETNPEYPHGTMIRYRCKEGYRLAGNNKIQCQNGTWEDVKFHCLRYEGPKKCKNLTPVENAVAQETMSGTNPEYPHGTMIRYRCKEGYRLTGNNKIQCQNGTWEDFKFHCLRYKELREKKCPQLIIQNGPIIPKTKHGKYSITCDAGFEVSGNHTLFCDNGIWSQSILECVPKRCQPLKDKFKMVNRVGSVNEIESGSTVRLLCRWSWEPKDGVTEATCVNGEWKPKRPICIAFCKLPRKGNRYFTYFGSGSPVVTSKVANRAKVVQHCRTGLRKSTSTCLNGRWRPTFRYCSYGERQGRTLVDNCTLPDNTMAVYINSSGNAVDVTEEISHGTEIMQVCRGGSGGDVIFDTSKSSYCHGGRWLPEFQNCTNICGDRNFVIGLTDMNFPDRSHVDVLDVGFVDSIEECAINCVNTTNFSCKAIQIYHFVNDGSTDLYCKLLSQLANGSSDKFITSDASKSEIYNVKFEADSNSTDDTDRAVCTRPDIEFSTLSPDLEEYYAREVVTVHCHTNFGSINENITCQATGDWSTSNITCEAFEHDIHCHPPLKSRMVYWPIKELYDVNDTLEVLTCGEGLVPVGSSEMRCIANETWEGDFECLTPCENGVPVILATNFHIPRHKRMDVKEVGYVDSVGECAKNCVEYANFTCKSIQVYLIIAKGKINYYCKLLSETAYVDSDKFIERRSRGSDIYNIQCDTSCRVPAENETKFRVTAVNGQRLKTNDTLPNGTILRVECINKQGEYEKQRTVTCLAGRLSGPIC